MSRAAKPPAPRQKIPAHLRLGRSGVHGYGIFARDFIPQDTRIIEYVGERITKAEALRREDQRLTRLAAGGDGCVYCFIPFGSNTPGLAPAWLVGMMRNGKSIHPQAAQCFGADVSLGVCGEVSPGGDE